MNRFLIIKMLSDETRFNIFSKLLDYDRLCVSELERLLGTKQANTSKHLKKMREQSIIESKREGNVIYYNIMESFLNEHEELMKYLRL